MGTVVCPAKAGMFSRRQSCQGKKQNPVARLAVGKETELLESNDKAVLRAVSELPGRSASEHIGDLETRDSEAEPSTVWRRQHG